MKVYNTLSDALSLAQTENGSVWNWSNPEFPSATGCVSCGPDLKTMGMICVTASCSYTSYQENIDEFLIPHLKIAKTCETASDCGITDDMKIEYLNNDEDAGSYKENWIPDGESSMQEGAAYSVFILDDGALVGLYSDEEGPSFMVDINGTKGPNVIGRDIFGFETDEINGVGVLIGRGTHAQKHLTIDWFESSSDYQNCTTKYESSGWNCAARIILEGKMNY